jgi:Na+(H+)/acetate symporter ActP
LVFRSAQAVLLTSMANKNKELISTATFGVKESCFFLSLVVGWWGRGERERYGMCVSLDRQVTLLGVVSPGGWMRRCDVGGRVGRAGVGCGGRDLSCVRHSSAGSKKGVR